MDPAREEKKNQPTNSLVLASSSLLDLVSFDKYDTFLMILRVMVWILKSQISIAEVENGIHDASKNHATISVIFSGDIEYCLKVT